MSICLFVCFKNALAAAHTQSRTRLVPRSPEIEPPLAAVGSATVAVLTIIWHSNHFMPCGGVTWCTIIAPFTCCCTNSAVASTAVVTTKRVVNARSVF